MSIKTSIKTSVVTVQMGGKRQRSVRKRQTAGECLMGKWNGAAVTGYEPQVSFGDYKKRLCVLSISRRRYAHIQHVLDCAEFCLTSAATFSPPLPVQ